jgi:periplasmic divalent cation tolerance protein
MQTPDSGPDEPNAVAVALCSCPDRETASRIAQSLVSEQLAACVSQIPGVESVYFWDGRLQTDPEILLMIKTTFGALPALEERIKALHPYELPELVAIRSAGGSAAYLNWVRSAVG